ncbi:N-6 DNA methylase [Nitrosomonas sp.]|uniref:N-6 DNA methylase n=1 Tax=Nitrosomonas sp. TaxID=42353 RepID=UPI0027321FF5|nr:N-6 DNA methylase [Nitrosomonas sp.]MDP2223011.1 N-6 DNA methylase [Nitrosomonas sp.]
MLDSDTKRRIDSCRNMLVGRVPNPQSQVEQITIALIYKFMDDMDAEAEELGGKRSFFTGEFEQYGWSRLMTPGIGGFDMLSLYSEAIQKMNENPGVPALFRDIFKNAYLPYRDPETLRSFLKEINGFIYDHSERLGDAFEYLLSVLGSQGDAGQFRTPRHIIDFMVEIVDPKKNESILDPACGTAGFLISSYKHILKHNTTGYKEQSDREAYDEKGVPLEALTLDSPLRYKGDLLTPDDKKRLATNIRGYDISHDMVRLSLVNMYLHGFASPHIDEYDTLTSDEKWNELADVILANPPFMSPKGGIKPHKRFSVAATRSEVLFVDYIAEHLTPNGRAVVIVPEGIIFQSGNAYKQLREMLVKNYLVAVISLPAGVFNPYSGVKTSILVLDKRLAKKTDAILFAKISNDGYNLGAQRRPIDKNDLPAAVRNIKAWLESVRNSAMFDVANIANLSLVTKEKIGENGEWNLSGERFLVDTSISSKYGLIPIGTICELIGGGTPSKSEPAYWNDGIIKWISSKHIDNKGQIIGYELITKKALDESSTKIAPKGSVILITRVSVGKFAFADDNYAINQDLTAVIPKNQNVLSSMFFFHIAKEAAKIIENNAQGIGVRGVTRNFVSELKIPLPPLEVQKEIVTEIEGYQKIIEGARQVVENYQPRISIHSDWLMVELGKVCENILTGPFGTSLHQSDYVDNGIPVINPQNIVEGSISTNDVKMVAAETRDRLREFAIHENDIIIGRRGEMGRCAVATSEMDDWLCGTGCFVIRLKKEFDPRFVFFQISSPRVKAFLEEQAVGVTMKNLNQGILSAIQIPLPDIDEQRTIVAQIEAEQRLVNANKELIRIFEDKIKAVINRVWGEVS